MFRHVGHFFSVFFGGLNTHLVGKVGATLVSIAGVTLIPGISDGLHLLPLPLQGTINVGRVALVALGSALTYFGRPTTVTSTEPLPQVAAAQAAQGAKP